MRQRCRSWWIGEELEQAERRYLPVAREAELSAVILAAGGDFGGLTAAVPKAML